eukprot:CAMPEP_0183440024 /NCGR_PEP_ID=MMETSP0370-20130417/80035_1 /TAXON_ID=268820 /ORGANISM="Peridinium aciculiferum, Strain PAER-2" /LENGTH=55 /DNA_ID=CAMNT_0025628719 /DNA_START=23 /DNA_END=190 /DNA_ORIENTATION=+
MGRGCRAQERASRPDFKYKEHYKRRRPNKNRDCHNPTIEVGMLFPSPRSAKSVIL